jgi:hypothetical protein
MTQEIQRTPARELTAEEQQARAELCFKLDQDVRAAIRRGHAVGWELAQALYEFSEQAAWRPLGFGSLGDWLGDPEVGLPRSTFFHLVRMYRTLVVVRQLAVPPAELLALEPSKLDVVLPAIESSKVTLDEALGDVAALSRSDLREKYMGPKAEPRADPPEDDPPEATGALATDAEPILASDLPSPGKGATQAEDAPRVDAYGEDAAAELEAWVQVQTAIASGQPFPRIKVEALTLLVYLYGPRPEGGDDAS